MVSGSLSGGGGRWRDFLICDVFVFAIRILTRHSVLYAFVSFSCDSVTLLPPPPPPPCHARPSRATSTSPAGTPQSPISQSTTLHRRTPPRPTPTSSRPHLRSSHQGGNQRSTRVDLASRVSRPRPRLPLRPGGRERSAKCRSTKFRKKMTNLDEKKSG